MARLPRLVAPGLPHLIVHRGLNGQPVFLDDADRIAYRLALRQAAVDSGVALHGYGLFPSEVRLIATPTHEQGLGLMMQSLGRRYVRAFNIKYQRSGTPWEGRFRSTVIEAGRFFVVCLRFAEGNEGHGTPFASGSEANPWTSTAHHLGQRSDGLVTEHPAFWALGNTPFEREANYRQTLERALTDIQLTAIRNAVLKGWALGSAEFAAGISVSSGRRALALPRGRPARRG